MRHAARQLPSWLIFDVRQMKTLALFMFIAAAAMGASTSREGELASFIRSADSLVIYSLLPSDLVVTDLHGNRADEFRDSERFHGFPVLGRFDVVEAEEREKLRIVLAATVVTTRGDRAPSLCFLPRHGVCVKKEERHVDVLLCFECEVARVVVHHPQSEERFETSISLKALESLNAAIDLRKIRRDIPRQRPNKAPEPTPGAVTPRATEGTSK